MEALVRLFAALTPAAWTAAAAAYVVVFVREDAGATRWAPRLGWTAVGVHLAGMAAIGAAGICPMLVPYTSMSALGLAVGLIHLCLARRAANEAIGLFPVAAAALIALAASAADPLRRPDPSIPAGSTALHVLGAILGYAGLLLAALFGALYLVQRTAMKRHRFGLFWERLPSLELLDEFSRRSLLAAVVFLTATIAFGHTVREGIGETGTYWDPKVVATNALWLLALVVVVLRRLEKLRPRVAAACSVALFVLALANHLVVDAYSQLHGKL